MNFCSSCGSKIKLMVPEHDNRERSVCTKCHEIHYVNPKIVTGILPLWDDKILMCKRAIEPRYGLWTLPAGFMENGETAEAGACREAYEEANIKVNNVSLYTMISLPHINQVYMMFKGDMLCEEAPPGIESLETALYEEKDIPWDNLAFAVINTTLKHFFSDRKSGNFKFRNINYNVDTRK